MLVVNAANTAKDFAWISEQVKIAGDAAVVDSSSRYALIAIQGPAAREVLQPLTAVDLSDIRYYWFAYGEVAAARVTISRTGYTGEDGYEIFVPPNMADRVWQALLESRPRRRRDPLRARRSRHAAARSRHAAVSETISTRRRRRSKLAWVGRSDGRRATSSGVNACSSRRNGGSRARWLASRCSSAVSRDQGYAVMSGGDAVGKVTSGTQTPFLKKAIGMAYVPMAAVGTGSQIDIDIRGRATKAQVVPLPFYKRCKRTSLR